MNLEENPFADDEDIIDDDEIAGLDVAEGLTYGENEVITEAQVQPKNELPKKIGESQNKVSNIVENSEKK